jgi:uncharacterized protein YqgC (DUF456 family)
MPVVYYIILFFLMLVGLVITIMTLPGLWLILAGAAIYAWLTHWQYIGWKTLVVLLVIAGLGEIVELAFSAKGARQSGGTRRGAWGALIGGVFGGLLLTPLVPIPIIGTLIGVCLGTFLGAMIGELSGGREALDSAFVGVGAAKGRLLGTLAKLALGGIMFALTLVVGFPHHAAGTTPPARISAVTMPSTAPAK